MEGVEDADEVPQVIGGADGILPHARLADEDTVGRDVVL
jgi:hypothetical protein